MPAQRSDTTSTTWAPPSLQPPPAAPPTAAPANGTSVVTGLAALTSILGGLVLGIGTQVFQGILPGGWNVLANSGVAWAIGAALVGLLMPTTRAAAIGGATSLVVASFSYYWAVERFEGITSSPRGALIWSVAGVAAGSVFGVVGHWTRVDPQRRWPALGLVAGVLLAEGWYLVNVIEDCARRGSSSSPSVSPCSPSAYSGVDGRWTSSPSPSAGSSSARSPQRPSRPASSSHFELGLGDGGAGQAMRPDCHAQLASSTRFRAPSLPWMLAMWVFTVLSEMNSSAPISAFVRPRATARSTSSSRSDNGVVGRGAVAVLA